MNKDVNNINVLYESVNNNEMVVEMAYGMAPGSVPITQNEIVEKVKEAEATGATPVGVTAVVIPSQRKKGNNYHPIYKVTQMNGMIGSDYERGVNRQREREGGEADFQRGSGWGTHESTSIVRSAKGDISIQIIPSQNRQPTPVYVGGIGGEFMVLDEADWSPFVRIQQPRAVADQQGVERAVIYRRVRLDNIVGIVIGRTEYRVENINPTKQAVLDISNKIEQE